MKGASNVSINEKNGSGSESVIATCIQRFRYQAPSSSESRSQISLRKFWWLDSAHENVERNGTRTGVDFEMPEVEVDSLISDKSEASKNCRDFDDSLSAESGVPSPRKFPEMIEIRSHGSRHNVCSTLPERSMITNAQLDIVLNLDNYAERLLMKCDMLLKGYSTSSTDKRLLGNEGNSLSTMNEADSRRYPRKSSVADKPMIKAPDDAKEDDVIGCTSRDSGSGNALDCSSDSIARDKFFRRPSTAGIKNEYLLQTDHSFDRSASRDEMSVSPIGLSLVLSADSFGDLMSYRGDFTQEANALRPITISVKDVTAESNVAGNAHKAASRQISDSAFQQNPGHIDIADIIDDDGDDDDNKSVSTEEIEIPTYTPYLPSTLSPGRNLILTPALVRSADEFLYVSSSSEMGATVRAANRIGSQEKATCVAGTQYEDGCDDKQGLYDYGLIESSKSSEESGSESDSTHPINRVDDVVTGQRKDTDIDNASTDDKRVLSTSSHFNIDAAKFGSKINQGEGSSHILSTAADAESAVGYLTAVESELPFPPTCQKQPLSPLTEAEVSPYIDDAIVHLLWTRLCSVRSQIIQAGSPG